MGPPLIEAEDVKLIVLVTVEGIASMGPPLIEAEDLADLERGQPLAIEASMGPPLIEAEDNASEDQMTTVMTLQWGRL